jgi:hypothetical protein
MATMTTVHPQPQRDPQLGLGHGAATAESRGGAFTLGAMSHAVTADSLDAAQARYNDLVPRSYVQHGVAQLTQNARSALSLGLAADDPRSGIFQGRRYLLTAGNGRSDRTAEASPVFADSGEYR